MFGMDNLFLPTSLFFFINGPMLKDVSNENKVKGIYGRDDGWCGRGGVCV